MPERLLAFEEGNQDRFRVPSTKPEALSLETLADVGDLDGCECYLPAWDCAMYVPLLRGCERPVLFATWSQARQLFLPGCSFFDRVARECLSISVEI